MLFVINYIWLLAASFAFVVAILTPNWLTFQKSGQNNTVERGIFYVCDILSATTANKTTQCVSIIDQKLSSDPSKWIYEFAIAIASLAISCAGLSLIALWISGIYFQLSRRLKSQSSFLLCMIFVVFILFGASLSVWILIISEALRLNIPVTREIFRWPMWVAVGATGGYLISFITMIVSFCANNRRDNQIEKNYYRPKNQF